MVDGQNPDNQFGVMKALHIDRIFALYQLKCSPSFRSGTISQRVFFANFEMGWHFYQQDTFKKIANFRDHPSNSFGIHNEPTARHTRRKLAISTGDGHDVHVFPAK